jgi:hypothetical protein
MSIQLNKSHIYGLIELPCPYLHPISPWLWTWTMDICWYMGSVPNLWLEKNKKIEQLDKNPSQDRSGFPWVSGLQKCSQSVCVTQVWNTGQAHILNSVLHAAWYTKMPCATVPTHLVWLTHVKTTDLWENELSKLWSGIIRNGIELVKILVW